MERKQLPIGISDYKELIDNDYYFVDKTDFVRQIVEEGSKITLLPRPRRFGKTLNLSTLRYFFERTEGNIYRPLFNGMQIEKWKDFDRYQGKYPVIMLTLKDCKAETFEQVLEQIAFEIKSEYQRHSYLLDDTLGDDDRRQFICLLNREGSQEMLGKSLSLLSDLLATHWGTPTLVLLDEYDTPVHAAYDHGFYDRIINFMRNLMSTVFKDNTDIFRGVITGILRVSKESLFSGVNNIEVDTLLNRPFCSAFGFTETETDRLLDCYGLSAHKEEVRDWYNGYLFGGQVIYNPWSLLNYAKSGEIAPYWVNTGSDVLLRHLIAGGPARVRREMEIFLKGGSIRSVINDKLAFPDLTKSPENIWSFMLFSGYLKAGEYRMTEDDLASYRLEVPNREVATTFRSIIRGWIDSGSFSNSRLQEMLQSLLDGDTDGFERILNEFVVNTLSYYDTSGRDVEKVYQAFLLGMLVNLPGYEVSSNREAGFGRYDIQLRPKDLSKRGFIMELKVCDPLFGDTVDSVLQSAMQQIEDKKYEAELRNAGVTDILKMAVTFDGKRVWVKTSV